jgi:Carboxypeptidase regulatory-like domain
MAGASRLTAASVILGAALALGTSTAALAQSAAAPLDSRAGTPAPLLAAAALEAGGVEGDVRDDRGDALGGVVVSMIGAATVFSITDAKGHFTMTTLAPGPYLVRAHATGYIAPKPQMIQVRANDVTSWSGVLRRSDAEGLTLLAAGVVATSDAPLVVDTKEPPEGAAAEAVKPQSDDHSETAWRLRHARRGVLRDAVLPEDLLLDNGEDETGSIAMLFGRAVSSRARAAGGFFAGTPFSGQLNILTTNSFDSPQELFSETSLARGIAYVSVGAPVGDRAAWAVRGAMTQADIASWSVAGDYTSRGSGHHAYDLGLSYSTQRYDGGNPLALREVTEGARNAGTVYGFDTWSLTPSIAVTYGAAYARYDYLEHGDLFSPRTALTLAASSSTRFALALSSRADAPGAGEFVPPPSGQAIWLPPQRTFSSAVPGRPLQAERTTELELSAEQDLGPTTTFTIRGFHQRADDQMVTLFGIDVPEFPGTKLGHYVVGSLGDVEATGAAVGLRSAITDRLQGSVEYTTAASRIASASDLGYFLLLSPAALRDRTERLHGVSTSVEAEVPETSTRVLVLYHVGNGYIRTADSGDGPSRVDSRFDVQIRQSLPFLDFNSAKWEMLIAVRNFFRDAAAEQSLYDELLTVRPPKRIVGGVTLRF